MITIHKYIQELLPLYNRSLYLQVKEVLEENKAERHIRGGIATRQKYLGQSAGPGAAAQNPATGRKPL